MLGLCLGMQLLFDSLRRARRRPRARAARRARCVALDASRALKIPHIGWNEVRLERVLAADRGAARARRLLPRALVRGPTRRATPTCSAAATTAARSRRSSRATPIYGVQFHPEKSSTPRPRAAAQLHRDLRADAGAVILYPAIDISEGQAVRLVQGDFDEKTVYRDSPLEAARAWVEAGARFLHVVDLDGARTGRRRTSSTSSASRTSCAVPVQYGGGLRSLPAVRDALRAGRRARHPRHRRLHRHRLPRRRPRRLPRAHHRQRRHPRRQRLHVGLAADDADAGRQRRSSACSTAACARSSTPTSTATGCSRARTSTRCAGSPAVVRGRFLYSGGIGSLDDLRGLAACARSTSAA